MSSRYKICRLCCKKTLKFVDLHELYIGDIKCEDLVLETLQVDITDREEIECDSNVERVLCHYCYTTLTTIYTYKSSVKEAQCKYKQLLQDSHEMMQRAIKESKHCIKKIIIFNNDKSMRSVVHLNKIPITSELNVSANKITDILRNENVEQDNDSESSDLSDSNSPSKSDEKAETLDRIRRLTEIVLQSYKMEDILDKFNYNWKKKSNLSKKVLNELFVLFGVLKCTTCSDVPVFTTYSKLSEHYTLHNSLPELSCCDINTKFTLQMESHILINHLLPMREKHGVTENTDDVTKIGSNTSDTSAEYPDLSHIKCEVVEYLDEDLELVCEDQNAVDQIQTRKTFISKTQERSRSKAQGRIDKATTAVLSEYKIEDIVDFSENKLKLPQEKISEIIGLFCNLQCKLCPDAPYFTAYDQLLNHSLTLHNTSPVIKCCLMTTKYAVTIERHILKKHLLPKSGTKRILNKNIPCNHCSRNFSRKSYLKEHIRKMHKDTLKILKKEVTCVTEALLSDGENEHPSDSYSINNSDCDDDMDSAEIEELKREIAHGNLTDKMRCQKAASVVFQKYSVKKIIGESGNIFKLPVRKRDEIFSLFFDMRCSVCPGSPVFATYQELCSHRLAVHRRRHPELVCCNVAFKLDHNMEKHIIRKHLFPDNKRKFKCKICGYLGILKNYNWHLRLHIPPDKRPIKCDQCPKRFNTPGALNCHVSQCHTVEPVVCDICGKTLRNKTALCHHMYTHKRAGNKEVCPICGKSVLSVKDHLAIHNIGPKLKCNICNKVVMKAKIHDHIKTHAEKKREKCPQCSKLVRNVKEHIKRVHEDDKKHICSLCPMKCYSRKSLMDHLSSQHSGTPRYACEYCERKFHSSPNYVSHRRRMHAAEYARQKHQEQVNKARKEMLQDDSNVPVFVPGKKQPRKRKAPEAGQVLLHEIDETRYESIEKYLGAPEEDS